MDAENETERDRIREAYLRMATVAKYRPEAPSDGLGSIQMTEEDFLDSEQLAKEASDYADRFITEEETTEFDIGVSDFQTNIAFVYTIEAARMLCGGSLGAPFALKLLQMAVHEVKTQMPDVPK